MRLILDLLKLMLYFSCLASMVAAAAGGGALAGMFIFEFLKAPIGVKESAPLTSLESLALVGLLAGIVVGGISFGLVLFMDTRENRTDTIR